MEKGANNMKTCTNCNTQNEDNSIFCQSCKQVFPNVPENNSNTFCVQCGWGLTNGSCSNPNCSTRAAQEAPVFSSPAYCTQCGGGKIDGVCPNCTNKNNHSYSPSDSSSPFENNYQKPSHDTSSRFKKLFMNPTEKLVATLGNTYAQNFLSSGKLAKAFSIVSDKRVYFRGEMYEGTNRASLRKISLKKVVNIRDVTGVSVAHFSPIGYILAGIFFILFGLGFAAYTEVIAPFVIGLIIGIINIILYFFKRITLLRIEYAGGSIGFDIKWFSEQENLEYQKALFLAKDKIFKD